MSPNDILNTDFTKPVKEQRTQNIKVIGVGGGGNNAVNHMYECGIRDVDFVLINTDRQVLDESPVPTKLTIGPGRGAGGKPERARDYAEKDAEKIAELFDDHTDMVFVTAGLGGGTGTGAGPVVARIAKQKGILTVGIVTIPFSFEGRKKILKALEGAREMSENVDALLTIRNERLTQIYPELSIFNAFQRADDTLLNAAQGITDIITIRGDINRDFNDVDTTLREGGTAIISTGYGSGENRVREAINEALNSPLLCNTDILRSKKLLIVLYVNKDDENFPFKMSETDQLTDFVNDIDEDVEVMWGLYRDDSLEDKVKITILASGFDSEVGDDDPAQIKEPVNRPTAPIKKDKPTGPLSGVYNGKPRHPALRVPVMKPEDYDNEEAIAASEVPTVDRIPRHGQAGMQRIRTSAPVITPKAPETVEEPRPEPKKPADDTTDDKGITGSISFADV